MPSGVRAPIITTVRSFVGSLPDQSTLSVADQLGVQAEALREGVAQVESLAGASGRGATAQLPALQAAADGLVDVFGYLTQLAQSYPEVLQHLGLQEAAAELPGPVIIFGLFMGEGLHGAGDAPRLVQELGRPDAVYAGTLAQLDGIEEVVAAALGRAMQGLR